MINPAVKISKKLILPLVVMMALMWAGCGGKKSTSAAGVAVTISPTTASVAGGATQQFTAMVTGSTNTAVTWQVNGTAGGDAIVGTISTTGLYTAPTVLPSTTTVAVTAVSQADTTMSAVASVTLTAPAVTITLSPTSATLAAGATQQFTPTVTVTGSTNMAVTWSIFGGPNPALGTISATGLYTAPLSPPKESITVVATSQANTTFTASAPVTVQFGNASLNGTYVFLARQGDNSSGSGFAFRGGTFVADGAGKITAGVSDSNSSTAGPVNAIFTGTYSVGADGRGMAIITDAVGPHTFSFALTSSTRGQLIEFDSGGATSGYIRKQDQTAIAAVSGPFVFSLSGDNVGPSAAVGQISFGGGTVTGTEDMNNGGSQIPAGIVGAFAVGVGGRGTLTINSSHFAFYIIDALTLALIDTDASGARTAGTAYAQSTTAFTNASLTSSAYFVSGTAVSGSKAYAQAGRFDTNAAGTFSGGVFDVNSAGTVTPSAPFGGGASYSVSATGRVQLSTGSSNFIVWLASPKLGVIMNADATAVATGLLFQQQTGFQSVTGGYAFTVSGADAPAGSTAQAIDGQLSSSGLGVFSGMTDSNLGGTLQANTALNANLPPLTNGRAAGTISGVSYDFYFVNPDRFILLSAGSGSVLSGVAERQCSDCQF